MPCYGPLTAYYSKDLNPSGKRSLIFDKQKSHSGIPVQVPCGQCVGCRLERSRIWAIRCIHEKRLHSESAFLTLTYSDENIPADGGLRKRDLQLFMKRLRKARFPGIRFYACGEYGETTLRPHYHVLLFNTDFTDKRFYKNSKSNEPLYTSKELQTLWPAGHSSIGTVTFQSAAYCARYILKKQLGPKDQVDAYYGGREKEFTVMSRRPGIGYDWFLKYQKEAYKSDSVIMNGKEVGIPRYYDTKYEGVDKKRLEMLKRLRRARARLNKEDNTKARRFVREKFETLKMDRFKRDI